MNNLGVTSHHPGLADGPIYLDYNATTPVDPRVAETTRPYLTTHFGNPSSGHAHAEQPHHALAEARQQWTGVRASSTPRSIPILPTLESVCPGPVPTAPSAK
jgi:selenocysteine lyase/cysteine desulfurase